MFVVWPPGKFIFWCKKFQFPHCQWKMKNWKNGWRKDGPKKVKFKKKIIVWHFNLEQLLHNFYAENGFRKQNGWTDRFQNFQLSPQLKLFQIAVLFGWLLATAIWLYMFFTIKYQFWIASFVFMVCDLINHYQTLFFFHIFSLLLVSKFFMAVSNYSWPIWHFNIKKYNEKWMNE